MNQDKGEWDKEFLCVFLGFLFVIIGGLIGLYHFGFFGLITGVILSSLVALTVIHYIGYMSVKNEMYGHIQKK